MLQANEAIPDVRMSGRLTAEKISRSFGVND